MQTSSGSEKNEAKEALVRQWIAMGIVKDARVLDAFRQVPREEFMLPTWRAHAYIDEAFPLMDDQTISQPTTVVVMLDALDVKPGQNALEVGTGSGYNAALLSVLVGARGKVITTEIVPSLVAYARKRLSACENVTVVETDGSQGYAREAPYDRIIVTAACKKIPPALVKQVKKGGIILAPVGPSSGQVLVRVRKEGKKMVEERLGEFLFVPLR